MRKKGELIQKVIKYRQEANDPVTEFSIRNKDSPSWSVFIPYSEELFNKYHSNIDGVKLKFKFTTLTINGRHKNC